MIHIFFCRLHLEAVAQRGRGAFRKTGSRRRETKSKGVSAALVQGIPHHDE